MGVRKFTPLAPGGRGVGGEGVIGVALDFGADASDGVVDDFVEGVGVLAEGLELDREEVVADRFFVDVDPVFHLWC